MRHWQHLSIGDRRDALEITSANMGLPQLAVEKDWWVTMTLKALSMTRHYDLMSFKGGTSLSKGWNLIQRFSEDIDIALRREGEFSISNPSKNQLAKVRRAARHYIIRELPIELENAFNEIGIKDFTVSPETERVDADGNRSELSATTHPSTIFVNYKSILADESEYIVPRVKIEISCLSMDEPVEIKALRSLMANVLGKDEDVVTMFPTVIPTRTFLEKMFLLHEEFQKDSPRNIRMSRHLYDIEKIMDTEFGNAIYNKALYGSVVAHRAEFNKVDGVDYSLHSPKSLCFVPPARLLPDWQKDYEAMQKNFIFDRNSLSFPELIQRMEQLTIRIQQIKSE